jgi:succinate dehydrogenase hydrophobic anchor subunit
MFYVCFMKPWISKLFLITGMVLLLIHNLAAHHHDDDYPAHIAHYDNNAFEHVQIDHVFSSQVAHFNGMQTIIPDIVYKSEYGFIQFPLALYIQPATLPDEPYPPGWVTDQTILRGPPSNC